MWQQSIAKSPPFLYVEIAQGDSEVTRPFANYAHVKSVLPAEKPGNGANTATDYIVCADSTYLFFLRTDQPK